MKTINKFSTAVILLLAAILPIVTSCDSRRFERVTDDILLRGDGLISVWSSNGEVTIKNTNTGKVTVKNLSLQWAVPSPNDSLTVFCSEGKRGFFNAYTGEIAVEAQYRRAWVFSEGLAAVQKNGMIGFIDHKGNTVIPFRYPYLENTLTSFTFKYGHCVVTGSSGKCGLINKDGDWVIEPIYDEVDQYEEYIIVSKPGIRMQVAYDGTVLNPLLYDWISRLTYDTQVCLENNGDAVLNYDNEIDTGLYSYSVGGRCGLMDANCHRLTEPLYETIVAEDRNIFRAILLDSFSEVILNSKGEIMF